MRQVPTEERLERTPVEASVDQVLRARGSDWVAEVVTVEPHRSVRDLWTAEAWLSNGAYLSLVGRSEDDVRLRLGDALDRLTRT